MGKTPYCNSTLETSYSAYIAFIRCVPATALSIRLTAYIVSEVPIAGPLTFHRLVEIVVGVCTAIAVGLSLYLMFMHATHYSKPSQQKQYDF